MSDKMKVIMEHWGRFVVEENSAQQIVDKAEQAKQAMLAAKDEATRKKFLAKAFVGVTGLAASIYLVPVLAASAAAVGVKLGAVQLVAQITKSGFGNVISSLADSNPEIVEKFMTSLPGAKDKLGDAATNLIQKLLNLPDEEAAKSDYLRALDLPDNLDEMLADGIYDQVVDEVVQQIQDLANQNKGLEVPSIELANSIFQNNFGVKVNKS